VDLWLLGFSFVSGGDPVLVWGVFDVFWGVRWVSVGFLLVIIVKNINCGFWRTLGRFRGTFGVGLWLLAFSLIFGGDPALVWGVFDVVWGLLWVSLGFPWSSCWKSVNCGFWRTSGRLRVSLGMDSWYLGFSSVFLC